MEKPDSSRSRTSKTSLKRTPISRVSKKPRRKAEIRCDDLWKELIRLLFSGKCALCGKHGCDAHHIKKRRNKQLRHEVYNGVWLCRWCHTCAEADEKKFMADLKERAPLYYKAATNFLSKPIEHSVISAMQLNEIAEDLRERIKSLKGGPSHG